MKLEVMLAEQQQKLGRMEDLEKELSHHRSHTMHQSLPKYIKCVVFSDALQCIACATKHMHCLTYLLDLFF